MAYIKIRHIHITITALFVLILSTAYGQEKSTSNQILDRVRKHNFEVNSGYEGVGDMTDDAWRIRILAIRDLVRMGSSAVPTLITGIHDENRHVRHVCVTVLGILGVQDAGDDLMKLLTDDPDPVVRGQTAQALGQIGYMQAMSKLKMVTERDKSEHVKHRARLAIRRLNEEATTDNEVISAWSGLDEKTFHQVKVGQPAPELELKDTRGDFCRLVSRLSS